MHSILLFVLKIFQNQSASIPLCRLLHLQPAEYCVLAASLSSTCLHWKSDCRELVLEASCFLFGLFLGFFLKPILYS